MPTVRERERVMYLSSKSYYYVASNPMVIRFMNDYFFIVLKWKSIDLLCFPKKKTQLKSNAGYCSIVNNERHMVSQ